MIFIDDCSIDNTLQILKINEKINKKFKIIKTPVNSGPGIARNLGLKIAEGKYICFFR